MRNLVIVSMLCFACSCGNSGGSAGGVGSGGSSGGAGGSGGGLGGAPSTECPPGPYADNPLPDGAMPQAVCSDLSFAEGPVWVASRGTLYLSDFQVNDASSNFNGRIVQYTPGGSCQEFIADTGTNGMAISPDGHLLACRHLDQTLTVFDLNTRGASVLVPNFEGSSFNTPNDVTVRSDGNIYFTDPTYQLGNRPQELPQQVYRRDAAGTLSVIETSETSPNGVTLSPDESLLYVAHIGGGPNEITLYDLDAAGAPQNPRTFVDEGSDGMVVDCAGNLYLTSGSGGVRVFSPSGQLIGSLQASQASNVAFGGPEMRTLYITGGRTLRAVELNIPGRPY